MNTADLNKFGNGPVDFDHRRSVISDNFLGDRLPERLGKGPVERRKFTDFLCLLICLVFLLFFIVFAFVYGFWNDYKLLTKPMDSDARICGEDDPVKNYPYLYIFKFDKNYRSVCVANCLKFDYNQMKYNGTGQATEYIRPLYYENYTTVVPRAYLKGKGSGSSKNSNFDYDDDFAAGYYTKEDFDNYTQRQELDCVPNSDVKSCAQNKSDGIHYYDSRPYTLNICFPLSPKIMKHMSFFGDISAGVLTDWHAARWMIFLAMLFALVLGAVFLFLSSYFISWLIWVMIAFFIIIAIVTGIVCWIIAFGDYTEWLQSKNYKPYLVKKYSDLHNQKWWMFFAGLFCFIVGFSVAFVTFVHRKSVRQASAILRHAVSVILKNPQLVLLALLCFALQVVVIYIGIWILIGIYTSGTMERDATEGEPIPNFSIGFFRWLFVIITIIAIYWIINFINNFADFISAATAVNMYFGRPKRFMTAFTDTCRYHLGSVALASTFLAPVSFLQLVFGWLFDLMTATGLEGDPNAAQKFLGKVCICFVYPYKKWILRVNETGFAMVYLASCDFCPASKEVYYLFLSYANKIGKLDLVTVLYKLAVTLTVALVNASIFYWCFVGFDHFIRNINNPFLPTLLIFFLTLVITLIFMNIYTTVAQASVLSYLIQIDVGLVPQNAELNALIQKAEMGSAGDANRYNPLQA